MSNNISVSMHLGSGKNAINNMDKIKRADLHNNRKYKNNKNQEIDLSLSQYNVTLVGTKNITEDIKEFYKKEFGEALYNYNKKQQREDRKILDYLEKMNNDTKSNIATEFIFQIGNAEDWENATMEDKQKTVEIFKKAIPILQEKNIKCFNASVHLDETSPHLHLLAVPVIEKQTRGLEKQVSQNKVITKAVLNDIRKEVEKTFLTEYNRIFNTNKELKKGSEIEEHLQVQDYKNTKKVLEVAKKTADKQVLKEKIEKDYKKLAIEVKEKEKETKILTSELTKLETEKEEKKIASDELKKEVLKQDFEIQRLEREKKTNETIIYIAEDIVKGLTENINTAEEERKKLEKEKVQKEKEKEEEQEKLDKLQKELNNKIEEQNRIRKEQQEILEKLENAEKSNTEKKKKLKEIEAENRELLEKIENAESNKTFNSNKLTLLENEMQDLDNVYTEEQEALDKLKNFKKTLHNLKKNDDYVIQAKFKKVEMFRNALSDVIDNVTEFAMNIKETFKTIKNSLENAVEENTLVEDINDIIKDDLKTGMEDFNSYYEEKQKDKIKDTIEEIKEIETEKDFF